MGAPTRVPAGCYTDQPLLGVPARETLYNLFVCSPYFKNPMHGSLRVAFLLLAPIPCNWENSKHAAPCKQGFCRHEHWLCTTHDTCGSL